MLGMVLTPYGRLPNAYPFQIDRSGPDYSPQLRPFDPYYNQRGEQGFYYDTYLGGAGPFGTPTAGPQIRGTGAQLGALPTDAEMGQNLCYTPVHSGWIRTADGYMAPPWTPGYGPGPGLGEISPGTITAIPEDRDKWPRRMFYLSIASTTAVVAVSLVNLYRAANQLRKDRQGV